ncbi:MAG: TolC family protein, partial [Bacteroidales bacterium]
NNQYGATVSLSQPLYTGGRILEAIKMSKYKQSIAINQSDFLRLSVCFQTDIQYWSTVARYEMIGIATELRNSMATLVKTI